MPSTKNRYTERKMNCLLNMQFFVLKVYIEETKMTDISQM